MKRLFDLKPHYREALAYLVVFQRLGFNRESVSFDITRIEGLSVIQLVLKNGIKQFACNIDKVETPPAVLRRGWEAAQASWEAAEEEERAVVMRRSYVARNSEEFLASLMHKGFKIDLSRL